MSKSKYTYENLMNLTVSELKDICREKEIVGVMKKPKWEIVNAVLARMGKSAESTPTETKVSGHGGFAGSLASKSEPRQEAFNIAGGVKPISGGLLSGIGGSFESLLKNPNAKEHEKMATSIRISSGSTSGHFNVVGQSIGDILTTLDEIFNIDKTAKVLVNGLPKNNSYILQPGDNLEFLKAAGSKS